MKCELTFEQINIIVVTYALGASIVLAEMALALIGRPYRTRGVAFKAHSIVKYDRAVDLMNRYIAGETKEQLTEHLHFIKIDKTR